MEPPDHQSLSAPPPVRVNVVVDVPRFGFTKHDDNGNVDYISPLPCPFNYGSIPGTRSPEGDRFDAIILGRRLARGTRVELPVVAVVHFTDAGKEDPKWICSDQAMTRLQRITIVLFFCLYARIKGVLNAVRRRPRPTRYGGIGCADPVTVRRYSGLVTPP